MRGGGGRMRGRCKCGEPNSILLASVQQQLYSDLICVGAFALVFMLTFMFFVFMFALMLALFVSFFSVIFRRQASASVAATLVFPHLCKLYL